MPPVDAHASDESHDDAATPAHSAHAPSTHFASFFTVGIGLLAILLLSARIRYGVEVLDESYYAAGSYRFALGLRPLLDDLGPHQFASYLVAPLVWIWLRMRGNLDGVILALRAVYLLGSVTTAAVAFIFLRKILDWRIAFVAAACSLGFVPSLIFAPNYNTIALACLSVSTSLAGIVLIDDGPPWLLVLSGLAMGAAIIVYPTQAATILLAILLLGWLTRSWRLSLLAALGAAIVISVFLVSIRGSLSGLTDFVTYNRAWIGAPSKLMVLAKGIVGATYLAPATYVLAAILAFRVLHRRVPWILTTVLPVAVLMAIHVSFSFNRTMNAAALLLLSVLVAGLGPIGRRDRVALGYVFSVATCAGLLFAYTSTAGFTTFGVGAAAAAAAGMAVLLNNAHDALSERFGSRHALSATVAIGTASIAIVLVLCWSSVAQDAHYPWQLSNPATGPYAGLLTSSETESSLARMKSDLRATTSQGDRLFVYGSDPSTYLLSSASPVAPNVWFTGAETTQPVRAMFLVRWTDTTAHRPTVIVIDTADWNSRQQEPSNYLLAYFDRNYRTVLSRPGYVILRAR